MSFTISGGEEEGGVVIGNAFDKYGSKNPIVRSIMRNFETSLSDMVIRADPRSVHEVGCGEGYWVLQWAREGMDVRGTDFSSRVIELARKNAVGCGVSPEFFEVRSIYELDTDRDFADLVVCCEVLEHLDRPEDALMALQGVAGGHVILSVPREPLWRSLNMARGKYLSTLGNTPGHVQHWSKSGLIRLVEKYFEIVEVRTPWPWTMVLCRP